MSHHALGQGSIPTSGKIGVWNTDKRLSDVALQTDDIAVQQGKLVQCALHFFCSET